MRAPCRFGAQYFLCIYIYIYIGYIHIQLHTCHVCMYMFDTHIHIYIYIYMSATLAPIKSNKPRSRGQNSVPALKLHRLERQVHKLLGLKRRNGARSLAVRGTLRCAAPGSKRDFQPSTVEARKPPLNPPKLALRDPIAFSWGKTNDPNELNRVSLGVPGQLQQLFELLRLHGLVPKPTTLPCACFR